MDEELSSWTGGYPWTEVGAICGCSQLKDGYKQICMVWVPVVGGHCECKAVMRNATEGYGNAVNIATLQVLGSSTCICHPILAQSPIFTSSYFTSCNSKGTWKLCHVLSYEVRLIVPMYSGLKGHAKCANGD